MTLDLLKERERGIEAQWARKHDEELIQKLRERAKVREISDVLAKKLRVDDPALRQRLLDLGVTRETGPALFFAPLIQIAWADGKVSDRERDTILDMAAIRGVVPGGPAHAQILEWLRKAPAKELFDAAVDVLRVGISVLPGEEREQRVMTYAESFRRVAEASGGKIGYLLGLRGSVSASEKALIETITATLRG
ncbi:MAG TPA: hypothetical protein VGM13_00170 [Thermoanaerobaculia bacterium]|jgi:hypothetical protein